MIYVLVINRPINSALPRIKTKTTFQNEVCYYCIFSTLAAVAGAADVPSLTSNNYMETTGGKTVFLKFFAPWVSVLSCYNISERDVLT